MPDFSTRPSTSPVHLVQGPLKEIQTSNFTGLCSVHYFTKLMDYIFDYVKSHFRRPRGQTNLCQIVAISNVAATNSTPQWDLLLLGSSETPPPPVLLRLTSTCEVGLVGDVENQQIAFGSSILFCERQSPKVRTTQQQICGHPLGGYGSPTLAERPSGLA